MKGLIKKLKRSPHLKKGGHGAKRSRKYNLEGDWPTKAEATHRNRGNPKTVHPRQMEAIRRENKKRKIKT